MLYLILIAAFASGARGITDLESEDCSPELLDVCVERLPVVSRQFGIPRNQVELHNHCTAYHVGMGCMDTWVARCMPGDKQKLIGKQTAGARSLMGLMCNSTAFQREYLRERACWPAVSADLSRCIDQLHEATHGVAERSTDNANTQLCCVRDEFDRCVWGSARARCAPSAARLLRRMTRLLSADVATCPLPMDAYCAASSAAGSLGAVAAALCIISNILLNFIPTSTLSIVIV